MALWAHVVFWSIQGVLNLIGVGASALGPVTLAVAEGWLGSYPPAALSLAVLPVAVALFALGPSSGRSTRSRKSAEAEQQHP